VEALAALISRRRPEQAEVLRFPPVMSRKHLERHGYLKSFPNLLGCVSCLCGSEREVREVIDRFEHGEQRWTGSLEAADLVLSPAACYPVYPIVAMRGPLPAGGLRFDVAGECFRREPSRYLDRLQSFRMREYVCMGSPNDALEFRERWLERAQGVARDLGLTFKVEVSSDPFFGRAGQMMAISQIEQALKFELLIPLRSETQPTACMSFNYHRDHFGTACNIIDTTGAPAHTACVAFGMDRLAVAMFHTHGTDIAEWPAEAQKALAF
jgi:seryl-tRNA synthetase